ncbi:hypothetical protein [Noviherbaspirillum aridicola]|nr:hypothetical protein [Noviherbaspirillum aridicola]
MQVLSPEEVKAVSGGVNWEQVGVGFGALGLGVAIAATPVGAFGAAAAAGISYFGGVAIGDGFIEGAAFDF